MNAIAKSMLDNNRMNVYYRAMRYKDEAKSESIFNATIQLLNEIGLAEISMSKIAKRAQVSPSTIYVYFENKEDMLNKLYLKVKARLSSAALRNIEPSMATREAFETGMKNLMDFALNNRDDFLFMEQFCNSPLINNVSHQEGIGLFKPLYDIVERGKEQRLLKQLDTTLLLAYCSIPMLHIAKDHFLGNFELNEDSLNQIIQMSWDAIKA